MKNINFFQIGVDPPPPLRLGPSGPIYGVRSKLRSLQTLPCLNSIQKASYTVQFFFTVILKYFYLNYAKKAGFWDIGGNSSPIINKKIIIILNISFFNLIFCSSYSLQKASYTLQFFFKVMVMFLLILMKKQIFGVPKLLLLLSEITKTHTCVKEIHFIASFHCV